MLDLLDLVSVAGPPAARAVFRKGEVSAIHLDVVNDVRGGLVSLSLTAQGETFCGIVVQAGVEGVNAREWQERLRSNLVDFVDESRFGWGQNRDVPRP